MSPTPSCNGKGHTGANRVDSRDFGLHAPHWCAKPEQSVTYVSGWFCRNLPGALTLASHNSSGCVENDMLITCAD